MHPYRLLSLFIFFVSPIAMALEEPKFNVIESTPPFELRQYSPFIVAEVYVDGDMDEAGSKGFRLIAGYIFGKNQTKVNSSQESEKIAMTLPVTMQPQNQESSTTIAMTAPVTMQAVSKANRWRMFFVMPSQYTLTTLPKPLSSEVLLREIPAQQKAVITFTGFNSEEKIHLKTQELITWMKQKGLEPKGEPQLARYNPPWSIPFLRRNEVMLDY